jgi:hypothetical protein
MTEIGQMLFGNPTEEYSVPREKWMGGPFQILIDAITEKTGEKDYGYTPHFSNDFFTIRPYYWGDDEDEKKLTPKRWNDLIQKCIKSLEE